MNSSKPIEISKSSIVGLKAELLKKQEEVKRLKELQLSNEKPDIIQKKKSVQQKSNEGIEKRQTNDIDVNEVDYDALQKSREVLEAKSRLYDKLKNNSLDEDTKSKYLIDFDLKREIDKETPTSTADEDEKKLSENEEDFSDSNSDPENDWVDFVDTLGRSRRCLRKDLPEMKAKDAKLAATLRPPSPPPDTAPAPGPSPTPELLSWDMQREMMRKKWEEQETLLLGKKDIHYQDVRFDEARPHGVAYFEFSTDEAERARQQEELLKMRAHTEQQQQAAEGLRARRQQQLQARLAAARQRRRQRLGLPPESPPHESETSTISNEEEEKEGAEEESIAELEESVKKIAPIRPWDIGKNGLAPVMSQEEWIEKKRKERIEEFAPPSCLIESTNLNNKMEQKKSNPNVFSSKRENQKLPLNGEKMRKKHKKTAHKKEEKIRSAEKVEGSDEESFGPSLKDWQTLSEKNNPVLTGSSSNTIFNVPKEEFLNSSSANSNMTTDDSRSEDLSGPQIKNWKPTITDIDQLLLISRAATSNKPVEEANQSQRLCSDLPNSTDLAHFKTSDINTNPVKSRNYSNITINTDIQKSSFIRRNESLGKVENPETIIKPIANLLEVDSDDEVQNPTEKCEGYDKWKSNKRKFAQIPPPPSMSYYIDSDKKHPQNSSIKPQLAESISVGMNYIKSQNEEKSKKRLKGLLDII